MSEEQTAQTEEEALSEVMAGYDNTPTRSEEPPVVEEVEEPASTEEEPKEEATEDVPPEVTVTSLAEELKALKAKVSASASDPDTIRKLHGEIGNINRTILDIQKSAPAPVEEIDEDAAALDATEEEYPELAGPIVKQIKALKAQLAEKTGGQSLDEINNQVTTAVQKIRQDDAVEVLREEHPDYETVRETAEFKTWFSAKTPEYKERLENTWNPAIVSKALTEFKDSLKKKETKQTRLASAITPQGVPKTGSSVIPDEEGLFIGYNSGHKRL